MICFLLVKLEQKINLCLSVLNQRVAHEYNSYLANGHIFVIRHISDIVCHKFQSFVLAVLFPRFLLSGRSRYRQRHEKLHYHNSLYLVMTVVIGNDLDKFKEI